MQRWMSRARGFVLVTVFVTACSDDPETTAPPPPPPPEETDTADRAALIAFYNATNGRTQWDEKENWNTPTTIRLWQGVRTNSAGFVTELALPDNNLSGTLPPQLGDLAHLQRLVLNDNRLTGPIPAELGKLSELTMLNLNDNTLSGAIPGELGALPRLDTLQVARNELSGAIPPELGNLSSLRRLLLAWNQLPGPVPPEPEWADSLQRIMLMGPEGAVTVERDDARTLTVVSERGSGRIRGILQDWEGALPAALSGVGGLEARTTRGLAEAVRRGR